MSGENTKPGVGAVSVIIVSYCRKEHLLQVLKLLWRQTLQPREVVVVDASPSELQLTPTEVLQFPAWLDYVGHSEVGNISRQRNVGISRVSGDTILFLDDDVEFEATLISDYMAVFEATAADGICGLVLRPDQSASQKPFRSDTALADPGGPNYQAFDGVIDTHVICTASFAIRRQVLLAVGGFDEAIYGTFDDVELGLRLVKAGFRLIHHNRPRLIHLLARASGSRSKDLPQSWRFSNLFYFQLRHYWGYRRRSLLFRSLWEYCRPSRHWLNPALVAGRFSAILRGYLDALNRLRLPPCLISYSRSLGPQGFTIRNCDTEVALGQPPFARPVKQIPEVRI